LLYQEQGRFADAETPLNQALDIAERRLGANHPITATIVNNLALVFARMGRYEEAVPLYKRALAIA